MFFKDQAHKILYADMIGAIEVDSIEYRSACYVLSAIGKRDLLRYMGHGIDFISMKEDINFSSGEMALLLVAANLFSSHNECDISILSYLDSYNITIAIEGIKMRYSPV